MKRSVLSRRFEEAMVYAAQLHARQKRKGTNMPTWRTCWAWPAWYWSMAGMRIVKSRASTLENALNSSSDQIQLLFCQGRHCCCSPHATDVDPVNPEHRPVVLEIPEHSPRSVKQERDLISEKRIWPVSNRSWTKNRCLLRRSITAPSPSSSGGHLAGRKNRFQEKCARHR